MRKGLGFGSLFVLFLGIGLIAGMTPGNRAEASEEVKIVTTVPGYAEEINNLKNLEIVLKFNKALDPEVQHEFLLDQRGVTDADGNPVQIPGKFTWPDPKTLKFQPAKPLKPNATYQVSLFGAWTKEGEEMLDVPFRLVFTTGEGK